MSENKNPESAHRAEDSSELFKSAGSVPHKVDSFSHSAVSGHAVDHLDEASGTNKVFVGFSPGAISDAVHVGSSPEALNQLYVGSEPEPVADAGLSPLDELEISVSKAAQMMQAVEAQRAEVESKLQEAQQILQQVEQLKSFISVDDTLRNRINATIARTASLRSAVSVDKSGSGSKK